LALSNRGLAKMNMLDYDGALDDVNRSILLYPQNAYSYRNRGMIYTAMNKNTEGCTDFQHALKLNFTSKYDNEVEEFYNHYCTTKKN
jgi:tetratricopeptide (TPR) repeat protein